MMMRCPNCNGRNIGKIGPQQFYCWTCYIEMAIVNNELTIHQVEADGSLSSLDDIFTEDERRIEW